MNLNEEQTKIVNLNKEQHLVLAPPGTGKTEILVQRLSNAVNNGINQNKMACLTFTNRAAKNMLDRVEKEIGEHEIFIGNMHNYCNVYLRKNKVIPQNISLLDEEDVELLFDEIIQDNTCEVFDKYSENSRYISVNELLKLNTFIKQTELGFPKSVLQKSEINFIRDIDNKNALISCNKYEQIKKDSHFIDFDDLLTLTYFHLINREKKEIIFEWLQIDEVQDLNPLQWAIVNEVSTKKISHRVFFGDYEQAIFSFMGAKLEILDKVKEESITHELQINYRSPQYLLDLYNTYAKALLNPKWKHEPQSFHKTEKTSNSLAYKKIEGTEENEIDWIIKKKLPKEPKESTAILVRSNSTADKFSDKFKENRVDFFKISGFDLFRRKVIKDLMAFLNVIVDDNDRNSWIRNFHLYGKIKTLQESRDFVNQMFKLGIKPLDFIEDNIRESYLDDFLNDYKYKRLIIFDTETTGLDTCNDDVIQIAAIEVVNGKLGKIFEVFINTDKDLAESEKIHNISKEHLNKYAIDKREAFESFLNFLDDSILVAHNLKYDWDIMNSNFMKCGLSEFDDNIIKYDSVEITKRVHPLLASYKLEYLLNILNIEGKNSHNALDDVKATANLVLSFEDLISNGEDERERFLNENITKINNFKNRFSPVYQALSSRFSEELPIDEVIGMIISYMKDHLNYKMKDNIYDEIDKLLNHMKAKCTIDELFININKYIPEYRKYKESDLVLGNEKITIATIHKAKGLEFENVIIPGCTDNNYPSYFSKKDGKKGILEDARLLYVAMTRTKNRLLLTSHTLKVIQTKKGAWELKQVSSRFLKPILESF